MKKTTHTTFSGMMSSKGVEYLTHAYYRSFSLNIFWGNTDSLLQALNKLDDPMEYAKSLSSGDSESRHQVLREVSRLFHNFLAGAMTLVDHTRVFVDEFYLGTEVHKEFKARVNREFAQNPLTRFVQDLRNYMIHRGLPPLNRHLTITPVEGGEPKAAKAVTGFYLPTQALREWRGWKSEAKKYLDAAGDQIDLPQLVENYRSEIERFHTGLDDLLREHHKANLEYLEATQADLQAQRGEDPAT